MKQTVRERVFIVGCPRSGTTLVQALISANSEVASFPESHFFEKLTSGRRALAALGIASRRARTRWRGFLREIDRVDLADRLPRWAITVRQLAAAFTLVLDTIALERGKAVWAEKTPGHLHHIDTIQKTVPGVKFIHVLRNGEDVIASLYQIGVEYADRWPSDFPSVEKCLERWITDARLSLGYSGLANHMLIRYEALVSEPRRSMQGICEFVGVPFEEEMLSRYPNAASKLILDSEPWKNSVARPIANANRTKFNSLFSTEQRAYILGRIPGDLPSGAAGATC